jgi:hypothetical protein
MPVGNGCLGAVSSRHFGGIGTCATFGGMQLRRNGLNLMAARLAPGEAVWLPAKP